ncbi:MAG: pentapeptide repeat-containing protein [Pseudomonadota bacterium]
MPIDRRLRRYQRRAPAPPPEPNGDAEAITRIDDLSKLARTTWFGLLAYLAFVGITLLGVEDADFFVPSRQTQLPLVNVAIPTASFFWFAPILGVALYAYLHLQLVKLWDALAKAPAEVGGGPLRERVYPWLINSLALSFRADVAPSGRPLNWLSGLVTRLLVWVAAPAVLFGFWWRSMPAHEEWLTLFIALCLLLALYVGFTNWWQMLNRMRGRDRSPWSGWFWLKRPLGVMALALVIAVSWLRTEAGLQHTATRFAAFIDTALGTTVSRDFDAQIAALPTLDTFTYGEGHWLIGRWLEDDLVFTENTWTPLSPTDLRAEDLTSKPADLRDFETARSRFRSVWCRRQGLVPEVCGQPATRAAPVPVHVAAKRDAWCSDGRYTAGDGRTDVPACARFFSDLDTAFGNAWAEEWQVQLSAANRLDLRSRDLRTADVVGAFLTNADLSGARLEGANLVEARLEGANLFRARLEGANLVEARLEGANLFRARLEGADLRWARLEGADLREARLEGADLWGARLEGADLRGARLKSASWAGGPTAAPAHDADFRAGEGLTQEMLSRIIGNERTLLPDTLAPDTGAPFVIPSCWREPPEGFDAIVELAGLGIEPLIDQYRRDWRCPGEGPAPTTGTPWPADKPPPWEEDGG